MPGLKELNNFRNNLQNIANEADVVANWKERYEEYPYPENPPLPEVDVDDLLGNIQASDSSGQENALQEDELSNKDSLDSIIDGMNNFTSEQQMPSDDALGSMDLPSPDIFSMPSDLDFNSIPSMNDADDFHSIQDGVVQNSQDDFSIPPIEPERERLKKTRTGKIDLEKWNATNESTHDAKNVLPNDDFLPPFDETIEDNSNDIDFSNQNDVAQDEPVDLSQFDFENTPAKTSSISSIEEPISDEPIIPPSIDEVEFGGDSNLEDDETDYQHDDITNDLTIDELSSLDNIPVDDQVDLSAFDPNEFESVDNEKESEGINVNESLDAVGQNPIEDTVEHNQSNDVLEDTEHRIDLSDFDSNKEIPSVSPVEELNDEKIETPTLEAVEDIPEVENIDGVEELSSDLSSTEEALSTLDEVEEIPMVDESIDGVEEIEPVEELEELHETGEKSENIGDFDVIDVGDTLAPAEDVSDNMLPLSSAEVDAMEAQDIGGDIDLGAFDKDSGTDDVDLYTEPVQDELEELDNSTAQGVAKPKQNNIPSEFDSFSNIDISSGGEEANIDEHAAFSISSNILDENISDTVGGFSIPDDYTQFSQDKNPYYSQKSKEKDDENIALTITEDEYQVLLERISSFPLNVRIEIEDYLANNDDTTISKMEFVHLIISGARLKKIASKLSEILEKPIPIPKGFERKTAEEYEEEKRSFKYKLRHKIVPFATIASLALLLTSCICFLFWTFVYIPVVSEMIYKKGYELIDENKYSEAVKEFNNAGEYKKKKRWYFKYAQGFRGKKQFQLAEDIYKRLLFDFNHDKKGGLEYVSMLRDDLHNYEKAETVLKRSVLDYHVNDEQALLSLGDTYLEWAREAPDKYEKARQTYSSLINMYGRKDHFLSRMMKYFIRTDKLVEVLPLKEYFLKNMKRLKTDDLTELGSYLVKKRYEDDISEDDSIKDIDDVREVLEAPLKRDRENADANYNMGRFFLYNRKFDVAEHYLAKSIDTYKNTNNLSSESIMNSIDARRLYGEILSENKEYLRAQEVYAEALSSYQEYSNNRLTSPNKTVGKLYSDYADINYFISGDLSKALQAYTMAINQMNDTPSIKYRIGYIYYQNKNYEDAMKYLTLVHTEKKDDKNLLYGLGNTLYKRGSYYVAQAYYERLMEMLEAEKIRKHVLLPHTRPDHNAFVDEYMRATNNLGVILNKLAIQDGSSEKNGRAVALFGESSRAWDALTRNPQTMVASKTVSLAYLNIQNLIKPRSAFETEIYSDIPKTLENERILTKEIDR